MDGDEERLQHILKDIEFNDWEFILITKPYFALRVVSTTEDNVTGMTVTWAGRKWLLSKHMTDGEVVQTAWLAVQTALIHEAREQFKYKGQSIFDPHYDIDQLVELRKTKGILKRK